jgi:hypothetical protein
VNPIPYPCMHTYIPKSAERGVATICVRSSGNLCVLLTLFYSRTKALPRGRIASHNVFSSGGSVGGDLIVRSEIASFRQGRGVVCVIKFFSFPPHEQTVC